MTATIDLEELIGLLAYTDMTYPNGFVIALNEIEVKMNRMKFSTFNIYFYLFWSSSSTHSIEETNQSAQMIGASGRLCTA